MKIKRIICILLAFQFAVYAQETKKKPSWTETMPEREETPGIQVQIEKEEDFGLDRSSLGFDRDEMSDTEDSDEQTSSQQLTNKIENQKQIDDERKKKAAMLAKAQKLEAERLAAERLEAERLEAERLEAERLEAERLEAKRLAAERLASQKAEQKKNQEQIAAQKTVEQNVTPNKITKQEPQTAQTSNSTYKWKKIKNVAPVYPAKAARKKAEGWVDVEITIDSSGKVIGARVIKTKRNSHVFDNSALKAVRKWKYDPPSKYGITTKLTKTIRMIYQL